MGRLPHHNTPEPVGRPRCNSVGHAIIASVEASGTGRGPDTCSSQRGDAARAAGRHHGAHATPRPQASARANSERVAWREPRASAA
eukprot:5399602-Prymnesium_polylepis.1